MKNTDEHLQYLFNQYLDGQLTKEEFLELLSLLETANKDLILKELISLWETSRSAQFSLPAEEWDNKMKRLMDETKNEQIEIKHTSHNYFSSWRKIAASLLILMTIGGAIWFIHNTRDTKKETTIIAITKPANDVLPGGNKAILTLSDGSKIILDAAQNGTLAKQGNTAVYKKNDQVIYDMSKSPIGSQTQVFTNTISTPRGGQYQIALSDGSKVWLNAASSIKFPTIFKGNERRVEITGEAYFEVAHNEKMVFIVKKGDAEVKVLGTHFNINAYDNEDAMKVTLLEGSVKLLIPTTNESHIISPGQQAQLHKNGKIKITSVDADETIAWKNGYFHFDRADIQSVMRQLSNWYDVDVIYDGSIPNQQFGGDMQRDLTLSQVLNILGKSQVKFKIQGKNIIISH